MLRWFHSLVRMQLFLSFLLCLIIILGSNRRYESVSTSALASTLASTSAFASGASLPPGFYAIHPLKYFSQGLLPHTEDNYEWFTRNIPFVDFHVSDENDDDPGDHRNPNPHHPILRAYYYRWKLYQKHIRFVPEKDFYVVTEFLPDVPWAGAYNTIPAAAGHHIMEGRWIHDERILNDYIRFWYTDDETDDDGSIIKNPNLSSYTNWIGYASWQRYLLNGNATFVSSLLDRLAATFRDVYVPKYLKEIILLNDSDNDNSHANNSTNVLKCWWQNDGYDAMEVSISGNGCRPTIASAMYGEAETIVKVSALVDATNEKKGANNNSNSKKFAKLQEEFEEWRELSRSVVLDHHWNPDIQSFAVIPTVFDSDSNSGKYRDNLTESGGSVAQPVMKALRRQVQIPLDDECDLSKVRVPNRTAPVRELLAFAPWYFDSLIPTTTSTHDATNYLPMWRELWDPQGFSAKWGLRTAEFRHACYNYSYEHGDCWNGPSWPYETARVLTGFANLLNRDDFAMEEEELYDAYLESYFHLLVQYAKQHTDTVAVNDTAVPTGSGHLFENLHPDLGYWNNRQRMYDRNDTNQDMGDDYNHSTYIDLILSGLLGIRPHEDGSLHINPLIPRTSGVFGFCADHVKVKDGKLLTVVWDRDGTLYHRYGFGQGLTVLLDGKQVAHSSKLELLVIHPSNTSTRNTPFCNSSSSSRNTPFGDEEYQ